MVYHPAREVVVQPRSAALLQATGREARLGGRGLSGRVRRPLQEEGPVPGRKDGRQLGGQKLSPSNKGTLAGGWGKGGSRGDLPAVRITARGQPVPDNQAWLLGLVGTCRRHLFRQKDRTSPTTSGTRAASNGPIKVCEWGMLLLSAHLVFLGPRAPLFIKLGPCCCL